MKNVRSYSNLELLNVRKMSPSNNIAQIIITVNCIIKYRLDRIHIFALINSCCD